MNLYWLILIPVLAATLCFVLPIKVARPVSMAVQAGVFAAAFWVFWQVKTHGTLIERIGGWPDYAGIALRADAFAAAMVLLTALLFLLTGVFQYRCAYVNRMFLFLFLTLEGLVTGIFLSNDLFNIFVLVEVATIAVSVLIMFKKDSRAVYDGMMYLMINVVSMSFFLFGLGMLYKVTGVIDFDGIRAAVAELENADGLILPYAMIITSVSLKAALMPLFSWLPKAHGTPSAPSVVSAILSGLYVKVGVYLFLRVQTVFEVQIDTRELFLFMGFLTAVIGFLLALAQKDIKLILAYHTVSQIGLIMMGLNMDSDIARSGGIYHIISHAFFKSTLFLTAGMIIDEYGTRDVYKIRGVFRRMPPVAFATVFAVLGIAGAPFFNGSISKYWIASGAQDSWVEYAMMLVNLGTVLSFLKYSSILTGSSPGKRAHTDGLRNAVVLTMGILCFAGGIFGKQAVWFLFGITMDIDALSYAMKVLGFLATLAVGALLYRFWLKKSRLSERIGAFEVGFNGICLVITLFFLFILAYLKFFPLPAAAAVIPWPG